MPTISELQTRAEKSTNQANKSRANYLITTQRASLNQLHKAFIKEDIITVVSNYPTAGILYSVPTHPDSLPIESILAPPNLDADFGYWHAECGVSDVDIYIVLATEASVTKFVLLVDSLGYSEYDVPNIKIYAGLTRTALSLIETWELPNTGIDGGSSVILSLKNPYNCRLVRLSISLPRTMSSSEHGPIVKNNDAGPFLHLGKIRISGIPTPCICTPQFTAQEQKSYQTTIRLPPIFSRTKFRPLSSQWRVNKKVFEVKVTPGSVLGFFITVLHSELGYPSQVKLLHVRAISNVAEKRAQVQIVHELQTFVIPKVRANTVLYYDFLIDVTPFSTFSFEFLTSYGGPDVAPHPPKINVYKK